MLPMTSSPAARHRTATLVSTLASRFARLRGCGSGAIALASFLLLPLAAAAVPMAPLTPAASAPAGASSGMNGPKRPGLIPPAFLSRAGGSADGLPQAPRRPVPGQKQNGGLTANR
jgi:hypothetical protein